MGIHHHQLHMATQLRFMDIPITDRGTILATGTMVIMVEGAIMDTGGKKEIVEQSVWSADSRPPVPDRPGALLYCCGPDDSSLV